MLCYAHAQGNNTDLWCTESVAKVIHKVALKSLETCCDPLLTVGPYLSTSQMHHDKALYKFTLFYFTRSFTAAEECLFGHIITEHDCPT